MIAEDNTDGGGGGGNMYGGGIVDMIVLSGLLPLVPNSAGTMVV